eukprot:Hpha_TRINITY_DN17691_c0_g1::TRINITY_DN17691_c0_g1_i1::g.158790::m.158790
MRGQRQVDPRPRGTVRSVSMGRNEGQAKRLVKVVVLGAAAASFLVLILTSSQDPATGPCVDNPAFKDDQGMSCEGWEKLGPTHCQSYGEEVFGGLRAVDACCVCRQFRRPKAAPPKLDVAPPVVPTPKPRFVAAARESAEEMKYPYCGD